LAERCEITEKWPLNGCDFPVAAMRRIVAENPAVYEVVLINLAKIGWVL